MRKVDLHLKILKAKEVGFFAPLGHIVFKHSTTVLSKSSHTAKAVIKEVLQHSFSTH